jgi:hypothetical protein
MNVGTGRTMVSMATNHPSHQLLSFGPLYIAATVIFKHISESKLSQNPPSMILILANRSLEYLMPEEIL